MPANLYQFHNQPDQLAGFATATESVPELAWDYYKNKKKGLQRLEHLWAQYPGFAYEYAHYVLRKRRFPLGEPTIAQHPKWASFYASDVLKRPWPEAEPAIARHPDYASFYARYVLKRPWPEAEPAIARHPDYAYYYARYVLKRPWPEAEPVIAQKPVYWNQYLEQFPERRPKTKTKKKS